MRTLIYIYSSNEIAIDHSFKMTSIIQDGIVTNEINGI